MTTKPETQAMMRIRRLSGWGQFAAVKGCVILASGYGVGMYLSTPEAFLRSTLVAGDFKISTNPVLIAIGYVLVLLPLPLYFGGLLATRRLLGLYERGDIFSERSAHEISTIGWSVALIPPVTIGSISLGALMLTWGNPPGQQALNFFFGTGDVLAIVYGLLLIIIGYVSREAALMSDEHRQFV